MATTARDPFAVARSRPENLVLSPPLLWSIVRLRLREVRPRKSPRSGTGPWHAASKLVKSLPVGSPSQDRDAGSNHAGATKLFFVRRARRAAMPPNPRETATPFRHRFIGDSFRRYPIGAVSDRRP